MKTIILAFVLVGLSLTAMAQTVEVTASKFKINGTEITGKPSIRLFQSILGPEDKKSPLANNLYTYNDEGIYIFETPSTKIVSAFSMQYINQSMDFAPTGTFKGKLTINGYKITKKFKASKLSKIPDFKVEDLSWSQKGTTGKYDIYFSFDDKGKIIKAEITVP